MKKRVLLFTFLSVFILQLSAFDATGHKIIADIAYKNLKCGKKKKVDKILGKRGMIYTSSWADIIKSDSQYNYSYSWHFQNLKPGITKAELRHLYDNPRLEGDFLFFALDSLSRSIKAGKGNDDAIKFVVHFVGDLFQPLHLGKLEDRGGNDIMVMWFGRNTRLHQIWDKQILQAENFSYSEHSQYLQDKFARQRKVIKKEDLFDALWETYLLSARIYSYDYTKLNSYDYMYHFQDDIDLQLYRAGIQLANLLNSIL